MNKPFFSIVIPAYNVSEYIWNTLDSVRLQTFGDYEVIVVNDGSIDGTLLSVNKYFLEYPYIKHKVLNQENKGIGSARNGGIKAAEGEFIAFLDADDKWYKEKLEKIKNYLDSSAEIDIVCHDELWVEKGKMPKKAIYGPYKNYEDLLFKGNCISTSATVVRKSKIFEAGLFSEIMDFDSVEDYDLWLRLSRFCKIAYFHEFLGEYHIHSKGVSSNVARHTCNALNLLEHHFRQWRNKTIYYKYLFRKRNAEILKYAGGNYIKIGDYNSARIYLLKSLRINPLSPKILVLLILCIFRQLLN